MKLAKFGVKVRIGLVVAMTASLVLAPQADSATSIAASTANLVGVPQGAAPTMNAMTTTATDPYTATTKTPDFFGTPDPISGYANGNFANSPLPVSVLIQGAGSGAFYIAEYNELGYVTKFDLVSQGSGYDWQPNQTKVSVIGGGGYGATGIPTIDHITGAITSIAVDQHGNGYGSAKGIRKFISELPTLPLATPSTLTGNFSGTSGWTGPGLPVIKPTGNGYTTANPTIVASDYYEIAAIRSQWQFSPDLPFTEVNMYVQIDPNHTAPCPTGETALTYPDTKPILNLAKNQVCAFNTNTNPATKAQAPFSYLGPVIVASQNKPVRITYDNYLPTGSKQCTNQLGQKITGDLTCGGDLMLPVDSTIMGAGSGPAGGWYSTNRSTIHLHGGVTPWISDGTMDQWVTPVNSNEQYPKGVSTAYVPDMWYDASGNPITSCYGLLNCNVTGATNSPGKGRMTFYYTNQDTARLMFYHDHSSGITRLNVYSGLAAGYLLHDVNEQNVMVAAGIRTEANKETVNAEQEKTLIIQDKTFVPNQSQLHLQDPTWNSEAWGPEGSLWFPHVYQPNQNPALTPVNSTSPGATPTGRWDYGPWMWPAVTTTMNLPVNNPLCNPKCTGTGDWTQNPKNPGVPNVSAVPEAFMDVMTVNGAAYPVMKIAPKVYRFQILNASNDRALNLSFYYAKSTKKYMSPSGLDSITKDVLYPHHSTNYANTNCAEDPTTHLINMWSSPTSTTPACADSGEVSMIDPTSGDPGLTGLTSPDQTIEKAAAGVQDMYMAGPDIVQIGTEGGFLPKAVVQPSTPIGFEYSRQTIVTTNVKQHALLLGPAQRADILVDFSKVPSGSTLILYNDAPAPFPGFDPRFDYYTGDADQTEFGGATSTLPGYGPNTRTIMQIQVTGSAGLSLDASPTGLLEKALEAAYLNSRQAPVVPQQAYDAVFKTNTVNTYPGLNDSATTIQETGVSSITVDPTKIGSHPISATTQPQVIISGGSGNGARAVPVIRSKYGVASVNTSSISGTTYTSNNLPKVTVDAPPGTSPSGFTGTKRTATLVPYIIGSDRVDTITVTTPGAGYTNTPNVSILGGSTIPASAVAVMKPTTLNAIQVNSGGTYTANPAVSIIGGSTSVVNGAAVPATGYAKLAPVGVAGVDILSSGLYTVPPVLTITPNSLDTGAIAAKLNAFVSTSIKSLTVTNPGTCTYTSNNPDKAYFDVTFTGISSTTVAPVVSPNIQFAGGKANLRSIDVLSGGANYKTVPTVLIQPHDAAFVSCSVNPTAVVQLTPGPITAILVDPNAIGRYTMTPTITSSNPADNFAVILKPTSVAQVTLTNNLRFTSTPTVQFSTGNAVATAVLNTTSVDYIQVINPGSGFIVTPQIVIDAPAGDPTCTVASNCATAVVAPVSGPLALSVVDPGNGYNPNAVPKVTITGGGATVPALNATLGNDKLDSIIVTNSGSGYLSAPAVTIYYPGDGAYDTVSSSAVLASQPMNIYYQPKGIGEEFELMYGRMDAVMSSEVPLSNYSTQTTLLWTSIDPPTEVVDSNAYDLGVSGNIRGIKNKTNLTTQIVDTLADGTELWRYTHNGVDTHFIHFHMFNVQVIARIGWDGVNQPLADYDLGWRDTVQFDPLTIMYIAIKPIVPIVPWQLKNSVRPLSPSDPINSTTTMMMGVDSTGSPITNESNVLTNFGWEYMVHCHLLGHEENDMMRPMAMGVALVAPQAVSAVTRTTTTGGRGGRGGGGGTTTTVVDVKFNVQSINATGFELQRFDITNGQWVAVATTSTILDQLLASTGTATGTGNWDNLNQTLKVDYAATALGQQLTLTDTTRDHGKNLAGNYQYRVVALNSLGTQNMGIFPTVTSKSDPSNIVYVTV